MRISFFEKKKNLYGPDLNTVGLTISFFLVNVEIKASLKQISVSYTDGANFCNKTSLYLSGTD